MKKILLAAAPLLLSACATPNPGITASTASAEGAALYCWQSKVVNEAGGVSCNWAKSAADACRSSDFSLLRQATIASGPSKARRCDNGEWLVMVTTR